MTGELILASTSPYRRQLLQRLGVPFRCADPEVDEPAFQSLGLGPQKLAERLAEEKARAVSRKEPGAFVLGGDQLATIDDRVLGKPGGFDAAVEQLMSLSGRTHTLITAISLVRDGAIWTHTDLTTLRMRALSRDAIRRYVEADRPLDCAGAYKLEARGIVLFERIESEDQTAITGLPLMALTSLLRARGFAIP
ncbi:MAG TPA: nucleoside triphosphate pyrophosphatase [Isosphaeraceae bacterium]|nr:nucleoside triphosphate pyrophosphatase [Isosphaeraceae bacterium]